MHSSLINCTVLQEEVSVKNTIALQDLEENIKKIG
jgi:hypothetical protein